MKKLDFSETDRKKFVKQNIQFWEKIDLLVIKEEKQAEDRKKYYEQLQLMSEQIEALTNSSNTCALCCDDLKANFFDGLAKICTEINNLKEDINSSGQKNTRTRANNEHHKI